MNLAAVVGDQRDRICSWIWAPVYRRRRRRRSQGFEISEDRAQLGVGCRARWHDAAGHAVAHGLQEAIVRRPAAKSAIRLGPLSRGHPRRDTSRTLRRTARRRTAAREDGADSEARKSAGQDQTGHVTRDHRGMPASILPPTRRTVAGVTQLRSERRRTGGDHERLSRGGSSHNRGGGWRDGDDGRRRRTAKQFHGRQSRRSWMRRRFARCASSSPPAADPTGTATHTASC